MYDEKEDETRETTHLWSARRASWASTETEDWPSFKEIDSFKEVDLQEQPISETVDGGQYISGFRRLLVLSSLTLVIFLVMLDTAIISTAIPEITTKFHALADVGWYGSAYLLTNCVLQPLAGKLYANFNSKYTFLVFLAFFELGSMVCGASQSSHMLIAGRAISGLGCSGLISGALTITAATVPLLQRPAVTSIVMSIGQIGVIGGPIFGGVLTQFATWRWCFFINLPIGAMAAILLLLVSIPDHRQEAGFQRLSFRAVLAKLDLVGFALFAPAVVMLLLALGRGGGRYNIDDSIVICWFCGAATAFIFFLIWEYRMGDNAMIPFSIVRRMVVWTSCLVAICFFGSVMLLTYYLPIYFQAVRGVSPTLSGVYILPGILSQITFAVLSGIAVGKWRWYLPWIFACGVISPLGYATIASFTPETTTGYWVCAQILAGMGRGCGFQLALAAVQNALQKHQVSVGMSIVIFAQLFGGTVYLTFGSAVFNARLASALQYFAPEVDYQAVVKAGAAGLAKIVTQGEMAGVTLAYNSAINCVFYLATATSALIMVLCWGMGSGKLNDKEEVLEDR